MAGSVAIACVRMAHARSFLQSLLYVFRSEGAAPGTGSTRVITVRRILRRFLFLTYFVNPDSGGGLATGLGAARAAHPSASNDALNSIPEPGEARFFSCRYDCGKYHVLSVFLLTCESQSLLISSGNKYSTLRVGTRGGRLHCSVYSL
ncbi:hypothetical protein DFH11DRAFT_314274 [Phellopilus nigrolimitatus]|nr:hypothetical protein DFH11DRAFT_314274 [Phellopilus nigrolimitatus]